MSSVKLCITKNYDKRRSNKDISEYIEKNKKTAELFSTETWNLSHGYF